MTRLLTGLLLLCLSASPASAQLSAVRLVSGLSAPIAMVPVPGLANTFLVAEQGGRIRVVQNGAILATDFLNLTSQIVSGGEQGLLGLVLAPDYVTSGRFWVNFTNTSGNTVVARFTRSAGNPLVADPASRVDLTWSTGQCVHRSAVCQSQRRQSDVRSRRLPVHRASATAGRATTPTTTRRIRPRCSARCCASTPTSPRRWPRVSPCRQPTRSSASPAMLPEIWDVGMRNPWRWSFDDPSHGGTGALVIGDVGQNNWEEVDDEPAGQGGRNYGWRNREGAHDNVTSVAPAFLPLVDPIWEYSHVDGAVITGGYVYRGSALGAAYQGRYFFADFGFGRVWSVALTIDPSTHEATASGLVEHTSELGAAAASVSSFSTDFAGELYMLDYGSGEVYQLTLAASPTPTPAPNVGGCTTPDPFVAFGGGTCVNGGWFPPSAPSPTPSPTPAPQAGGCLTPDPFVALGGGVCFNGGWFPPSAPPAPSPSPSPTPTPTPTPQAGGCLTPDPFVAFGGGVCFNGGWFPPTVPPAPTPTPTPMPTPTPSGACLTPDPFVGIPGLHGVCFNGGWYPVGG